MENDWIELDPDYRKDEPDEPHCCRCMKKFKGSSDTFIFVEIKYEGACAFVRKSLTGSHLIGKDCWNKIIKR